jgi:1,4-alpha-glucan branching enzyme
MAEFLRFTRDLIHLRRRHPALRADPVTVWQPAERVVAYQRWVPGAGQDVVVVSLAESTFYDGSFRLGFPHPGRFAGSDAERARMPSGLGCLAGSDAEWA